MNFKELSKLVGVSARCLAKRYATFHKGVSFSKVKLTKEEYQFLTRPTEQKIVRTPYKISIKIGGVYWIKAVGLSRTKALQLKKEYEERGFKARISKHIED